MYDSVEALAQHFGHTTLAPGTGYNPSIAGGGVTPAKAPGFFSSVGHTLAQLPGEVGSAVVHGVVDPFAHLISNASASLQQGPNSNIDQRRQSLDQQSHALFKAYQAGHITKAQFQSESKKQMGAYQDLQGAANANMNDVKSSGQMLPDAIQAAGTALTLGAGGLEAGAAKGLLARAGQAVAGARGADVAGAVGAGIDSTIGSGRTGNAVSQLAKGVAKNAIVTQPTIQFAGQTAHDVASGNIPAAAGDLALAAAPKGLELAAKGARDVIPAINEAMHGRSETLTDALGVRRVANYIADNANIPENVAKLKRIEMFTEDQPNVKNGVKTGGQQLADHIHDELKLDPHTTPIQKIVDNMDAYARNHEALQGAIQAGVVHPEAVITHGVDQTVPTIAKEFAAHGDAQLAPDVRLKMVNDALDRMGVKNDTLRSKLGTEALQAGTTGNEIAAALTDMKQKFEIPTPEGLLDSGFTATYGPKERATLPTLEQAKEAGMPKVGSNPSGVLGKIGTGLQKAGLGLQTTPSSVTQRAITDSLAKRLEGTGYEGRAQDIMQVLKKATSKTQGVFDPRLLKPTVSGLRPGGVNIEQELGVSASDAKMILKAVKGAYGDLPLGVRSLGEKLTDKAIQHLPPMAPFLKAQGYGKYTANPIFWIKQGTKGEFIGQAETGGKPLNVGRALNSILGTAPKQETMNLLQKEGYTSKAGMAGGESDFFGNLDPELGQKISGPQVSGYIQQSMGQAAEQFAKNNSTTVSDILKTGEDGSTHPLKSELDNLMQMVVGYPKGNNALNSNLAKSLNVLVFPSRFEAKVAGATAKYFMSQPKVVQLALINDALKGSAWAASPQGKQWQKDNADALGVLNYFSPTHTINEVVNFLHSGNAADLGQVGGMPFGVITTILKNQGIALPSQLTGNETNPATGENYVQKLPTTDKARLQQVATDLIGQMFSYPGATVGLPSKTSEIQSIPGLKINPKDQSVVGGTPKSNKPDTIGLTPASVTARSTFTPFSGAAKLPPEFKKGALRGRKPKTLAKPNGQF